MTVMSDTERRATMASTVQPTPRSAGGAVVSLSISLYADGHSTINTQPTSASLNCNDDMELAAQLIMLLRKARKGMRG